MRGFGTVEAAARFCCDARRIAQLPSFSAHHGRRDLSPRTTTGFSPASCRSTDSDTSSLIGQRARSKYSIRPVCFSVVSVLIEPCHINASRKPLPD
jgi:hypothetical protein